YEMIFFAYQSMAATALVLADFLMRIWEDVTKDIALSVVMGLRERKRTLQVLLQEGKGVDHVSYNPKSPRIQSQDFHGTVGVFPVKEVDTTGAGDSFVGALLAKIVDDQSVLQMGRMYKPSVFDQLALDLINDWVEDMSRRPHSRLVASTYSRIGLAETCVKRFTSIANVVLV
ncbi:probable fructokinase-4, partial [Tanacetum coccineum]